jgi:hypothetical protein
MRKPRLLTCALLTGFVLIATAEARARHSTDHERELAQIRETAVLLSPELARTNNQMMIALLLRDQIHRAGVPATSGVPALSNAEMASWSNAYKLSNLFRSRSNACNGKSVLYMLALRAFGIPSRMVAFYASATAGIPVWSHASVDVFIGGEWVAMDPTFNVAMKDGGGSHLSWTGAVDRLRKGGLVVPHSDGMTVLKGQSLSNYEMTVGDLKELVELVLLGPWEQGDAVSLNPGWDGKIRYIDGSEFDAWGSITGDFYRRIAGSPY